MRSEEEKGGDSVSMQQNEKRYVDEEKDGSDADGRLLLLSPFTRTLVDESSPPMTFPPVEDFPSSSFPLFCACSSPQPASKFPEKYDMMTQFCRQVQSVCLSVKGVNCV